LLYHAFLTCKTDHATTQFTQPYAKVELRDTNANIILELGPDGTKQPQYAAPGCVNTSMGAIMYAYAHSNASINKTLDINKLFRIAEKYYTETTIVHPKDPATVTTKIQKRKHLVFRKMRGGTASKNFYDWDLMAPFIEIKPKDEAGGEFVFKTETGRCFFAGRGHWNPEGRIWRLMTESSALSAKRRGCEVNHTLQSTFL
jgi:hypothetical protein